MSLSCIDGPALPCNETGCPAPIINCSFLAANNACELPIEKIWEKSAPIAHPMPVWMYCGLSCKQCGSDTLTEADLDRIARHDGPAVPERVWGVAGNQLNSGARHASIYAEMTEARRTCDAERLWRPAGGEDSQLNHDYLFHESVRDLDCEKPLPPPTVASWVQRTKATLTAIRRGVERLAQGKSVSKAKIAASTPGAAAESTEGDAAPGRTPFWLAAIRVQKGMGYSTGSKAFRCAQRVHSGMVLDHPRNLAPSAAPKLLRCTVAARGGAGGAGAAEPPHNWTFTRAGPFVGYGGYDWHTTLWNDAMGTEVVVDAHGDTGAADVNAWFLGPTSEAGEPLGFPPVHMHHAHIRNGCISAYRRAGYASPKAFGKSAETAREPDEACPSADWVNATAQRSGALVFESHQDSMCHDDPGSETAPAGSPANGARCYLKVLPAGAAIRVVPPLRLDAQLNDVRPIAAPNETPLAPLNMYFQVALRWRPAPARTRAPAAAAAAADADATPATPAAPRVAAAALVTVGNPGSEATRTSSKDSQKLEYSALTGVLRLMLARGSRNVPTLYYAGFTLPLAIANSAKPLEVHSMFVHWHQRIASAVFCLASMPSQLGLPPLLLPHSPLQLPNTNGTAYASLVRRLLSHPALRCASVPSSGLQFVPARPGASAAGWYDRRPHVYCVDGWQVRPGDNLTFVWLDERHANPYAAVARAAASPTWAALPRDAFTVEGGDAASAAARAEQLQGAGPAYESTMSGVIGPPTVVPQHYIARLLLIANHEDPPASPAAAAADAAAAAKTAAAAVATGAPARSAGPLQCCCIPAVQVIRNSASNPRLAELRTMYEDVDDPGRTRMKNSMLLRTPAPGNSTDGNELWRWGWRSGTMRNLNHDDIQCGGWGANVNCG